MQPLQLYVCEDSAPEFQALLEEEDTPFQLFTFPSLCSDAGRREEVAHVLSAACSHNSYIFCSSLCRTRQMLPADSEAQFVSGEFCFNHLISDDFARYLVSQGSYIVNTGRLSDWLGYLRHMGFDKKLAGEFFRASASQLVYLDSGIVLDAAKKLAEFADYVGLSYKVIEISLQRLKDLLNSLLREREQRQREAEAAATIQRLAGQYAESSAIIHMLSDLSVELNKRSVVNKMRDLFSIVFGAQRFSFFAAGDETMPAEVALFAATEKEAHVLEEGNRILLKVSGGNKMLGTIDVGEFLFSDQSSRYLDLAVEIGKVSGLVLFSAEQYEEILKSQERLLYVSYHDALTGLHNRSYLKEVVEDNFVAKGKALFVFDIDGLKMVNDSYGHHVGDRHIRAFAEILGKAVRDSDIVARVGGDEFIAILPDVDRETAERVEQRVIRAIEKYNSRLEDKNLTLRVSVGMVMAQGQEDTMDSLLREADRIMYENKARYYSRLR